MQLYASRPIRAAWQIIGDLIAIATVILAVWISQQVREAIASLGVFGARVEDAGSGFSSALSDAAEAIASVPLAGTYMAQPFLDGAGSADELAAAGVALSGSVETLATTVATALWVLPVLLVVLIWVIPRLRFAIRAGASKQLASTPAGRDLLALRALVGQPTKRLLTSVHDPVAAFRNGDEQALAALAALELRAAGITPPRAHAGAPSGSA